MNQTIKKPELENFDKLDDEKIFITIPEFRNKGKKKVFILKPEYENKVEKKVKEKKIKKKIRLFKKQNKTTTSIDKIKRNLGTKINSNRFVMR